MSRASLLDVFDKPLQLPTAYLPAGSYHYYVVAAKNVVSLIVGHVHHDRFRSAD